MIRGNRIWIGLIASVALAATAQALVPEISRNPYEAIPTRNVFSLKDPTILPPVTNQPAQHSKITLTGITTILGSKKALMTAQLPARPPEPAKLESYMLTEGQRDGDIEVITIDEKAGTVQVRNAGNIETLDFVNNGAKLTAAPASLPMPGGPAPMGMPGPTPMGPGGGVGMRQIPTRQMRAQGNQGNANSEGQQPYMNAGGSSMDGVLQQHPVVDPDVQTVLIEAQRMKMKQDNDETFKILPPTEMTGETSPDTPSPFSPPPNIPSPF
jgi:hypothetical protein